MDAISEELGIPVVLMGVGVNGEGEIKTFSAHSLPADGLALTQAFHEVFPTEFQAIIKTLEDYGALVFCERPAHR